MRTFTLTLIVLLLTPNFIWANCNLTTKFSYKTQGLNVGFNNQSTGNYSNIVWNFGDGTTSTQNNPSHQYANSGEYKFTVTLQTQEGCLSVYDGKVYVFANSIETKNKKQAIEPKSVKNYPEPFINTTNIDFFMERNTYVVIDICNVDGLIVKNLLNTVLNSGKQSITFNAENLPTGVYFAHLKSDSQRIVHKIIVQ